MYLAMAPAGGRVRIFDRDLSALARRELPPLRRRIGVVFQDFRLLEHLSAMDNVALPLRVAGAPEAEVRAHVGELLSWVGLADQLHALPATLSGGQQQRVAIARAVIARPQLLLADEPTGNVDDAIAMRLMFLFQELYKMGTTVVIATHNDALVNRFNHRQLRIVDGSLRVIARESDGMAGAA
jgi:cell division transport system ATP-binding protein